MKKSIKIATLGVAALNVAALPMFSAFAEDSVNTIEDQLELTVGQQCTFSRQETAHGEEGWGTSDPAADVFRKSVTAGQHYDELAHSHFNVTCNDGSTLFDVSVVPVATTDNWTYNVGGYATEGSSWTLSAKDTETGANLLGTDLTNNLIMHKEVVDTTKVYNFTITYGAQFASLADSGKYTATADYTFVQNDL